MSDADKRTIKKEKAASRKEARRILEGKGVPKSCAYCGIEERDFTPVWGEFYGGNRGAKLEPDHKDNDFRNNDIDNLCWACCLCNCAKSNKLTHPEMKDVGKVIRRIWKKKSASRSEKAAHPE